MRPSGVNEFGVVVVGVVFICVLLCFVFANSYSRTRERFPFMWVFLLDSPSAVRKRRSDQGHGGLRRGNQSGHRSGRVDHVSVSVIP